MYNHARFVEVCLDSIRDEGYPHLQVVLVDDGSDDNSFAVAQRWRERNPEAFADFCLHRQANRGVAAVLNRLVQSASSEWLVLVSADDYLLPGGIGIRLQVLRRNPSFLWLFADSIVVDDRGRKLFDSALVDLYRANKTALAHDHTRACELILRWSPAGSAVMVRKQAFDPEVGVGSYDEETLIDDRDIYLRLLSVEAVGFVDACVAAYRLHDQSATHVLGARLARSMAEVERRHITRFSGMMRLLLRLQARRTFGVARFQEVKGLKRFLCRAELFSIYRVRRMILAINDWRAHRYARNKALAPPGDGGRTVVSSPDGAQRDFTSIEKPAACRRPN